MRLVQIASVALLLAGCSSVNFNSNDEGATYYEPVPYLFYSVTDSCISSVNVVAIPGNKRHLDFTAGYGSSNMSAEFANGLLTKVGQTSDSKAPETLASVAALKTAGLFAVGAAAAPQCKPVAVLYPIENGVPNTQKPINFAIGQ